MFAPFWWTLVSVNRRSWYVNARKWYRNWLLVLLFLLIIFSLAPVETLFQAKHLASFSQAFVRVFLIQHFALLLVITPAMAAGAVTEDKAHGTLEYLLTTPLWPLELILAKWLAYTILIGELALIGLPLLCLFGVLAGLELPAIVGVAAATVLLLLALSAISMLASVWCRKTTVAVFTAYTLAGLAAAVVWYFDWADFLLAPFSLAGFDSDGPGLSERLHAAEAWGVVTLVFLLLASWRLRPAFRRHLEGSTKRRQFWFQRPTVGDIPLRWKEHYAGELAAVPFLKRCPRWLLLACVTALTWRCRAEFSWLLRKSASANLAIRWSIWTFSVCGKSSPVLRMNSSYFKGFWSRYCLALRLPFAVPGRSAASANAKVGSCSC
jgi:hypothetical protein